MGLEFKVNLLEKEIVLTCKDCNIPTVKYELSAKEVNKNSNLKCDCCN